MSTGNCQIVHISGNNDPDAILSPNPDTVIRSASREAQIHKGGMELLVLWVADCNVIKHTTGNKHIDLSDSGSAVGMTTEAPSGVLDPPTAAAAQFICCNNVSLATQCANNHSNAGGSHILNLEAGRQGPVQ